MGGYSLLLIFYVSPTFNIDFHASNPMASSALKWSIERRWVTAAFCLALLFMILVNFFSYQNATQLITSQVQVKQTNEILTALINVSETLTDIETRRWRYFLLGEKTDLDQYDQAMQRLITKLEQLRQPFADTPTQEQRLDILETLIQQRRDLVEQSIDLYPKPRSLLSSAHPLVIQTNQNQAHIRQIITELQTQEEQILQNQVDQFQANSHIRMAIENLGTILTFIGLFGVYTLLYRQMFKRQQLEQVQQKLAQEKELGELKLQFFSMVSHEFRTPLSVISGSSQLLKEKLASLVEPDKLKNLLQIQASAKLMTQLLNDILTLARADAGKLECKPELLEMQFFCLNLIEDIQVFSEQPRVIKFDKFGTRTYAYLDEKLLYSILSNLLSNAIKYSSPNSTVYFTLICEPEVVMFQVKDEGIGIPKEEQAEIFEPFRRGRNASSVTGSGLGMAVVKKCLDLHQGQLSMESEVGIGTIFTVKIPQTKQSSLFASQ
ncbi:signal transduction histidine kinase [Leptolyngbyaceae cyanobacterium JSC-12]|nr:signal transduction histidine kinase [Leptolyngbyaceae cyanobacterium JSC-12]